MADLGPVLQGGGIHQEKGVESQHRPLDSLVQDVLWALERSMA